MNLNSSYKPPRAAQGFSRPLVGAGRGSRGRSLPTGIKAKVTAPEPINLPSKRSENRSGSDAVHGGVASAGSGWGSASGEKSTTRDGDQEKKEENNAPQVQPTKSVVGTTDQSILLTTERALKEGSSPWKSLSSQPAEAPPEERETDNRSKPSSKAFAGVGSVDDFPTLGQVPSRQGTSVPRETSKASSNEAFAERFPHHSSDRDDVNQRHPERNTQWRRDQRYSRDDRRSPAPTDRGRVESTYHQTDVPKASPTRDSKTSIVHKQSEPSVRSEYEWASDENEIDYDRLPSWMADSPLMDEDLPKTKDSSSVPVDEYSPHDDSCQVDVLAPKASLKPPSSLDMTIIPAPTQTSSNMVQNVESHGAKTTPQAEGKQFRREPEPPVVRGRVSEELKQKARERIMQEELIRQKAMERAREKSLELEKKQQQEEERKRQEEREKQRLQQEELERKRKKMEELRKKEEELRKQKEEELKRKREEEERKREEERKQWEEEQQKLEEETKRRRAEEARRQAEEAKRREELKREKQREAEQRRKEAEQQRREELRREHEREAERKRQEEAEQRRQQDEMMRQFAEKKREELKRQEEARSKQTQMAARAKLEQLDRQFKPAVAKQRDDVQPEENAMPSLARGEQEGWRRSGRTILRRLDKEEKIESTASASGDENTPHRQGRLTPTHKQTPPRAKLEYRPKETGTSRPSPKMAFQPSTVPPESNIADSEKSTSTATTGDNAEKPAPLSRPMPDVQASRSERTPGGEKTWSRKKAKRPHPSKTKGGSSSGPSPPLASGGHIPASKSSRTTSQDKIIGEPHSKQRQTPAAGRNEARNTNVRKPKHISATRWGELPSDGGVSATEPLGRPTEIPSSDIHAPHPTFVESSATIRDSPQPEASAPLSQPVAETPNPSPDNSRQASASLSSSNSPQLSQESPVMATAEIPEHSASIHEPNLVPSNVNDNTPEPTVSNLDTKEAPMQEPTASSSFQLAASAKIPRGNRQSRTESPRTGSSTPNRRARGVLPNGMPIRSHPHHQPQLDRFYTQRNVGFGVFPSPSPLVVGRTHPSAGMVFSNMPPLLPVGGVPLQQSRPTRPANGPSKPPKHHRASIAVTGEPTTPNAESKAGRILPQDRPRTHTKPDEQPLVPSVASGPSQNVHTQPTKPFHAERIASRKNRGQRNYGHKSMALRPAGHNTANPSNAGMMWRRTEKPAPTTDHDN